MNQGIAPSTFCVFDQVAISTFIHKDSAGQDIYKKRQERFLVQPSLTIPGITFHKFLKQCQKRTASLNELDLESVSAWILCSFLTLPSDAKGDNFIVKNPQGQNGKKEVVSIDSDRIRFHSYEYHEYKRSKHIELEIKTRNIFFLLQELMVQKPDQKVKDYFLNIAPDDFILTWLKSLKKIDRDVHHFLEAGLLSPDDYKSCGFPLQFRPLSIQEISHNLKKIQFWLRRDVCLNDIFRNVHLLLCLYYGELLREKGAPLSALNHLYNDPDSLANYLDSRYILKSGDSVKEAIVQEIKKVKPWQESSKIPLEDIIHDLQSEKKSAFPRSLKTEEPITELSLPETLVKSEDGLNLCQILSPLKNTLTLLNLGMNYLDIKSFEWLSPLLRNQYQLRELNLYDNDLQSEGTISLVQILNCLPHLTKLNVSGNWLKHDGLKALAGFLSGLSAPKLTHLSVAENHLLDTEGDLITQIIKGQPTLEELDLRWNGFSDKTGQMLVDLAPTQLILFLEGTLISNSFQEQLDEYKIKSTLRQAYLVKDSTLLKKLLRIRVKKSTIKAVQECLNNNGTSLEMSFDSVENKRDLVTIQEAIGVNFQHLQVLQISYCSLKDAHVAPLMTSLTCCPQLIEINFSGNKVRDKGAEIIAQFIQTKASLLHVMLHNNKLTDQGGAFFINLKRDRSLVLDLLSANRLTKEFKERIKGKYQNTNIEVK